ncbi:zinc-dependent metalloprotease family protein [Pantoea cypripedii]|uniref:reprolysin-like metallopeptidase n=1 Tax=Pantoea cypripedii TaxID=55209 RepID=UPI002FC9E1D5
MFTFKQKLLFTLIASTLSSSVFAAPLLFSVAANDPNRPDTPLLRSLQEDLRDYQLININKDVLLSRSSSFLFKAGENGQEIEIKASSLEKDNVGNDIWRGKAENEQAEATFSIRNGNIRGGITLNDGSYYEIYPVADGLQALEKVYISHINEDEHDIDTNEEAEVHQHELSESQSETDTFSADTTPAKIRVLYLYTNQSRADFIANPLGQAGYLNDKLNEGYVNSDTYIQFDIAGVIDAQVDETKTNITQIRRDIANADTAVGKLVAAKRKETHADLVTIITKNGDLCGIAELGKWTSAVKLSCAVVGGPYTLAHEIGHNFGLGHHVGAQSKGPYAHGYSVEGKFRTIMAYPCLQQACSRLNRFSTPLKNHNGLPMGTAAQNDAVRFLREVRFNFSDIYPYWDSQYQLADGDLPAHQYFEINLTDRQTNKTLSLDKKVTNTGQWTWPFEIATAVNSYFPKGIVEAGRPRGGVIIPASGSSYLNHIWLHQDKKDAYKVDVQRKTYAVVRGNEWGDVMAISGGDGVTPNTTVVLTIKNKTSGQALETYYFNNGGAKLEGHEWPHLLAATINNHKSSNVIAGELKDGHFGIVNGTIFRNLLWFPLDRKNDLTAEFSTLNIAENPWIEQKDIFGDRFQTDLASGTTITVAVKNSSGAVVEQRSVEIPDGKDGDYLSRYRWPAYLAHEINKSMTQIRLGGKQADGSINVVEWSQYLNYMWKKDRANQTVVVTFSK